MAEKMEAKKAGEKAEEEETSLKSADIQKLERNVEDK